MASMYIEFKQESYKGYNIVVEDLFTCIYVGRKCVWTYYTEWTARGKFSKHTFVTGRKWINSAK